MSVKQVPVSITYVPAEISTHVVVLKLVRCENATYVTEKPWSLFRLLENVQFTVLPPTVTKALTLEIPGCLYGQLQHVNDYGIPFMQQFVPVLRFDWTSDAPGLLMFNMTVLSLFVELLTLKYRKLIGIDLQRDCTNRRELASRRAIRERGFLGIDFCWRSKNKWFGHIVSYSIM